MAMVVCSGGGGGGGGWHGGGGGGGSLRRRLARNGKIALGLGLTVSVSGVMQQRLCWARPDRLSCAARCDGGDSDGDGDDGDDGGDSDAHQLSPTPWVSR